MPKFSKRSLDNLKTCHPDLIRIAEEVIKKIDFTVIKGHRSIREQKEAVKNGFSKTMKSKHLEIPSRAFDYIPYPFNNDWNDKRFAEIGKVLVDTAKELGILARWGGDWNMNGTSKDERFYDSGHFELLTNEEFKRAKK